MDTVYATHRSEEPGSSFDPPVVLRSSRDLLAAIPYLLGFRPRDCCVVVCITGDGRVGLVARIPLGELDAAPEISSVAAAAGRVGAELAVVAVYSAQPQASARAAAEAVLRALDAADARLDVEAWLVSPTGFRGLDCADPACCPATGHPLSELEHGEVSAAFVVAGRAVAGTEDEAYRISRPAGALRERAARAATRAERARETAAGGGAAPADDATRRWRAESYGLWCELMRHAATELRAGPPREVSLPPAGLGRLAAALADVTVRDAVLLSLVPGAHGAAGRTVGAGPGGGPTSGAGADVEVATARAIARVVDPRVAVPPEATTADAARLVLEQVVGHVPRRLHAPPLALLGFLAWWRGDGGRAARRVRDAARQDPGYRLAALLDGVLRAAVPPGWVRAGDLQEPASVPARTVG